MIIICCFKQKTAYDMRISDWSSDVCSSDLRNERAYVHDLTADSGFTGEQFCGGQRAGHHHPQGDQRAVRASPQDFCGTERIDDLSIRNFTLGGVERLMLEEDYRDRKSTRLNSSH